MTPGVWTVVQGDLLMTFVSVVLMVAVGVVRVRLARRRPKARGFDNSWRAW